jgi:hypothetical protein
MLRIVGDDMWDPRNWVPDDHEHRIYADESLETYAIVDARWYPYLCRFKWSIHDMRKHLKGFTYLRRTITVFHGPDGEPYESPTSGKIVRNRKRTVYNRFLHQEVMLLTGIPQPTPEHTEVDHKSRNTLDCREGNLEWATRAMQVINSRPSPGRLANLKQYRRLGKTSTATMV